MKVCAHLPTIDDPQVQHLANEDARAYLLCLKYEKEFATIASKLRSMHPIRMFALKSPSAYFGARMIATSSILVHFLNVTSSYLVVLCFSLTPCMSNLCSVLPVQSKSQRSSAMFQRTPLKVLLRGCEESGIGGEL